jgi:hypothetical protein
MRMTRGLAALSGAFLLVLPGTGLSAAELAPPEGPVVLTVAGEIEQANRPAFDARRDLFLHYHERDFTKAVEFDTAMLADSAWRRSRSPCRIGPRRSAWRDRVLRM